MNFGMNFMNMFSAIQNFRQNPMQMLAQRGMNVPQDVANDPNAILNHLLQTGQVNHQQVQRAQQMAQMFRR